MAVSVVVTEKKNNGVVNVNEVVVDGLGGLGSLNGMATLPHRVTNGQGLIRNGNGMATLPRTCAMSTFSRIAKETDL